MEELYRTWVATVFTANAVLDSRPAFPAFIDGHFHQAAHGALIQRDEGVVFDQFLFQGDGYPGGCIFCQQPDAGVHEQSAQHRAGESARNRGTGRECQRRGRTGGRAIAGITCP